MDLKRVELHDGTTAIINTALVLWLEPRDTKTTRIHFSGSATIHVKGSLNEIVRQISPGL